MHFNSIAYFFFLVVVLALYYSTNHRNQNRLLLAASYLFYGWWDVRFLFLIVTSTVLDYCCGLMIGRAHLSRSERFRPSIYLLVSSVVFLAIGPLTATEPGQLATDTMHWAAHPTAGVQGWGAVASVALVITVMNLLYPAVLRLREEVRRRISDLLEP